MTATPPVPVNVLVEGPTDVAVARRLLSEVQLPLHNIYGQRGKDHLLQNLFKYNQAARFSPWFVLVDLDDAEPCAPPFVQRWLPDRAPCMLLRVAVCEVESWLIADTEAVASFLGIPRQLIPLAPDQLPDPKQELVNLVRRSRRRKLQDDMVPRSGSSANVGPGYTARVIEFVQSQWRPYVARNQSGSLNRCLLALEALRQHGC